MKENIDSLIEDLSELGYPGIEMDIKYGYQKEDKFKDRDKGIGEEILILNDEKIRRIRGEAYSPLLELEVVTSKDKRIKLRIIHDGHNQGATHLEFYYTIKKEPKKYYLINNSNAISIRNYFDVYVQGIYSPVELFLMCIELTILGSPKDAEIFTIPGNITNPLAINDTEYIGLTQPTLTAISSSSWEKIGMGSIVQGNAGSLLVSSDGYTKLGE